MTPEDHYQALADAFADDPEVVLPGPGGGFGADALKLGRKIFAMLVGGRLVVKLPEERVAALLDSGEGDPFVAGGHQMREWVTVAAGQEHQWHALATEARAFIASLR